MFTHLTAILLALVVGFAAGVLQADVRPPATTILPPATPATPKPSPAPSSAVAELEPRLVAEIRAREDLEIQVAELWGRVRALETRFADLSQSPQPEVPASTPEIRSITDAAAPILDEAYLLEAGLSTDVITSLRTLVDQLAMEQLYLDDRAEREGWINTPRYFRERGELTNGVLAAREQLGDQAYDHLLHALGRPNRVMVQSVIGGSAAEQAGVQSGDQVLAYGGQRVFSGQELQQATRAGSPNETVSLEVLRAGASLLFYLPRGPIGIRMETLSARP